MNRDDLALGLAVVALVPSIFGSCLPPLAVVRGEADDRGHAAAGVKQAAITAGILVAAVVAYTGSPTVAILGAGAVLAYAVMYEQARTAAP